MEEKFGQYTYDGKFEGNVLIVSRTGCGKTTFIQKLVQNKMFGNDIVNVFWVSKIFLDPDREEAIRNCFVDQNAQLAYPNNIDDFKSAQIAAKKIGEKYKKIREAKAKKRFKLRGEVAVGDTIGTKDGEKIEIVLPLKNIKSKSS